MNIMALVFSDAIAVPGVLYNTVCAIHQGNHHGAHHRCGSGVSTGFTQTFTISCFRRGKGDLLSPVYRTTCRIAHFRTLE